MSKSKQLIFIINDLELNTLLCKELKLAPIEKIKFGFQYSLNTNKAHFFSMNVATGKVTIFRDYKGPVTSMYQYSLTDDKDIKIPCLTMIVGTYNFGKKEANSKEYFLKALLIKDYINDYQIKGFNLIFETKDKHQVVPLIFMEPSKKGFIPKINEITLTKEDGKRR